MKIKQEVFDKINELDESFSEVEAISRVLTLYDNADGEEEEEGNDKEILINLLFDKVLVMKNCINNFTSLLRKP